VVAQKAAQKGAVIRSHDQDARNAMVTGFILDTGRHEYRKKPWIRAIYAAAGLIGIIVGYKFAESVHFSFTRTDLRLAFGLMCIFDGVLILVNGLRSRVVIDGTRIEITGLIRTRSAELSEIEGYRLVAARNGFEKRIYLRGKRQTILLESQLETDEYFHGWFEQIRDLTRFQTPRKDG
jgi:hypothetical protein